MTLRHRPSAASPAEAGQDAPLRTGLVVGAHGRHFIVEDADGRRTLCHPRGKGKKNDCVVGDRVHWAPSGDGGVVEAVAPRRNLLHRQDDWRSKSFAANIDQLLVLVAVEPMYAESQLSRALIAAAHAGIPALIVLNKIDLPGTDAARQRLAPYAAMGVPLLTLSLKAEGVQARAALAPWLAGRATLVLGPSGMGKSTLINLMLPSAAAQVGEISQALNSGRHTTTTTRWYWLDDAAAGALPRLPGDDDPRTESSADPHVDPHTNAPFAGTAAARAALIDSPGFQEFGLRQIAAPELAGLMPDLAAHRQGCRFHNCSHLHEPGCSVRAAVEAGAVSPSRWRIYQELWQELSATRW